MPDEPPLSPELISVLRDQLFEEMGRLADLAVSYSHSIAEAAYRGDEVTMVVHMRQLRECLLAMFAAQKDFWARVSPGSNNNTRGPP